MTCIIYCATLVLLLFLTGCFATKLVKTPKRGTKELFGFVPVIGEVVEGAVDTTVKIVDLVSL